jgi:hypothetical protein
VKDPRDPQDAATKNYVDILASSNLNRTLRTPENIPSLPGASVRANKIVAFDNSGNPMVTLPPSGSASDVLIELAKPTGADHSGIAQGGTVQNALPSFILMGSPVLIIQVRLILQRELLPAIESIGAGYNSCYIIGTQKFAKFKFGRGIYMFGDIVLPSGCVFEGESSGLLDTNKSGSSFLFKTQGTQNMRQAGSRSAMLEVGSEMHQLVLDMLKG